MKLPEKVGTLACKYANKIEESYEASNGEVAMLLTDFARELLAASPEEKATLKAIEGRLNGIANAMAASLLATPEMAYWRGVIEECYDLARGAKAPPSPQKE